MIKPKGISVIEMKAHSGRVEFNENTPWIVGTQPVRGGSKPNPFQQVRAYRQSVRNFLRDNSAKVLNQIRDIAWDHISTIVTFGGSIQFDESLITGKLRMWFQIADLSQTLEKLFLLDKPTLELQHDEILRIPRLLGLTDEHLYLNPGNPRTVENPETLPFPKLKEGPIKLVYLKEFPFREYELQLKNAGGARFLAAQAVRKYFNEVRQGINPFTDLPQTQEPRIEGAVRYHINHTCDLLMIGNGRSIYPAFVGTPTEVENWITAHPGLVIVVDSNTGRLSVTSQSVTTPTSDDFQAPALSSEIQPFLSRIKELNLDEYPIPRLAKQILQELDETSTAEEIEDALDLVQLRDVKTLLFDLINLVRAGNIDAAQTRLKLRDGEAVPATDAGALGDAAPSMPVNSDQAIVINDISKDELDRLLDPANFEEWMLFLHPDQRQLAEARFEKPLVLTGVSGSGKTCILVHRARTLANRYPGERIGIMTLSKPLAALLKNLVNQLCSEDERKQIAVLPFYEHFKEALKVLGLEKFSDQLHELLPSGASMHETLDNLNDHWPKSMVWDCDPINKAHVDNEWEEFYMQQNPDVREWLSAVVRPLEEARIDASRYLEEEFTLVRSGFPIPSRTKGYSELERVGRTYPFRESLRRDVLQLVLFWEDWLLHGGMIDSLGLTLALLPMHQEMQQLPENLRFRCLLLDEFQDLSSLDLQILRRIVPITAPDALFLAGDTVQRMLVKRLSLTTAALDRGSAIHKSIRKNYRNSRQILRAAAKVANHYGTIAKSQGEEIEVLDPELAQRETNPPIALKTDSQVHKAWEIVLECLKGQVTERWTFCIVTAAPSRISIQDILVAAPEGVAARELSGDCILRRDEVTVSSFVDLKGFEFRMVLIIGCDHGLLPDPGVPHDEVWRDALRLYVAITRGRDQVYLIYENQPSEFIEVMGDAVLPREEPVLHHYLVSKKPKQAAVPKHPRVFCLSGGSR